MDTLLPCWGLVVCCLFGHFVLVGLSQYECFASLMTVVLFACENLTCGCFRRAGWAVSTESLTIGARSKMRGQIKLKKVFIMTS
jgi:hypothetical protein